MVRDEIGDTTIIGSGLIATAMQSVHWAYDTVFYAAGVSNSECTDPDEFKRERNRIAEPLLKSGLFVYFSSCGVVGNMTPYLEHKLDMEELVKKRGNYLIIRLPIVAGHTPNPHTLLNFLYARISRSEKFKLWRGAYRNVIDIADVSDIVESLIRDGTVNETVNVASPHNYPVAEIVRTFEEVTGKPAIYEAIERYDSYPIDTRRISGYETNFSGDYLFRTLKRYYR